MTEIRIIPAEERYADSLNPRSMLSHASDATSDFVKAFYN